MRSALRPRGWGRPLRPRQTARRSVPGQTGSTRLCQHTHPHLIQGKHEKCQESPSKARDPRRPHAGTVLPSSERQPAWAAWGPVTPRPAGAGLPGHGRLGVHATPVGPALLPARAAQPRRPAAEVRARSCRALRATRRERQGSDTSRVELIPVALSHLLLFNRPMGAALSPGKPTPRGIRAQVLR